MPGIPLPSIQTDIGKHSFPFTLLGDRIIDCPQFVLGRQPVEFDFYSYHVFSFFLGFMLIRIMFQYYVKIHYLWLRTEDRMRLGIAQAREALGSALDFHYL